MTNPAIDLHADNLELGSVSRRKHDRAKQFESFGNRIELGRRVLPTAMMIFSMMPHANGDNRERT